MTVNSTPFLAAHTSKSRIQAQKSKSRETSLRFEIKINHNDDAQLSTVIQFRYQWLAIDNEPKIKLLLLESHGNQISSERRTRDMIICWWNEKLELAKP
jgi:hypothetical protein